MHKNTCNNPFLFRSFNCFEQNRKPNLAIWEAANYTYKCRFFSLMLKSLMDDEMGGKLQPYCENGLPNLSKQTDLASFWNGQIFFKQKFTHTLSSTS